MFQAGELIKFSPFVFKNGNQPKPKYCIVLGQINDKVMMANLPTSKDHVQNTFALNSLMVVMLQLVLCVG